MINKAQGVAKDNIDGSELQITYVDDDVMKTDGKRRNERRFTGPSSWGGSNGRTLMDMLIILNRN